MNQSEKNVVLNLAQAYTTNNQYLIKYRIEELLKLSTVGNKNNKSITQANFYLEQLNKRELEIPANLYGLIEMKLPSDFDTNKYYVTSRENKLLNQIKETYDISNELEKMNIRYLNSTLLWGISGTGKTLFGQYLAYKLNLPFIYINFGNLVSSYMGKTGNNISNIFNYVSSIKCVFMIDEIDAISTKRSNSSNTDNEMARITISLMQNLDKLQNNTVLLAATNRIDIIDQAVIRRFTFKHEVEKFTHNERKEMIKYYVESLDNELIKFTDEEIENVIHKTGSNAQSYLINNLIQEIIRKIKTQKFQNI